MKNGGMLRISRAIIALKTMRRARVSSLSAEPGMGEVEAHVVHAVDGTLECLHAQTEAERDACSHPKNRVCNLEQIFPSALLRAPKTDGSDKSIMVSEPSKMQKRFSWDAQWGTPKILQNVLLAKTSLGLWPT